MAEFPAPTGGYRPPPAPSLICTAARQWSFGPVGLRYHKSRGWRVPSAS